MKSLAEDDDAWTEMADSLVVFVTPAGIQTYRLPNNLGEVVEVSDRFHVKPLLRTATFPQAAFVLALAAGSVRLLHLSADGPPEEVNVADLPRDAWDSSGNHVFKEREGRYIRLVERALRPVLNGQSLPLILAATEGVAATFRTVNTYPHLAAERSAGNPETSSDADLAAAARMILDEIYADEVKATKELFDLRRSQGARRDRRLRGRPLGDLRRGRHPLRRHRRIAVRVDRRQPPARSTSTAEDDATNYGVIDEIARRVYLAGGRVLAVRAGEVPGDGPTAAILRYAPMA